MIKKLFAIISISIIFSSCSIFKVTNPTLLSTSEVDAEEIDTALKFIGDYELTAYNLPGRGDQTFKMSITKDKNVLSTTFDSESETGFDVLNTLVEDDILFIEIFVVEFGLKTAFEIYVEGNKVSGYVADQFEIEGTIVNKSSEYDFEGTYNLTFFFGEPYGKIDATLELFYKNSKLSSKLSYFDGKENIPVVINNTELFEGAIFINLVDPEAGNIEMEVYFDDQKTISGFYASQFKFQGKRIK